MQAAKSSGAFKVVPPGQSAEERKELKATTMVSRKNKVSVWQKEKKRLRAVAHQAAKREEADEPEKASSSGLPPLQRRRVEEKLAGGETPEVHDRTREKTEGMKRKSQASKAAARARYRLNKWNRDNAVKDETLDWEEEQIAEWRKENPGEEEEWPLEEEGGEEEEPLEDSEPEPLEPIEYEPSEPGELGSLNNIEPESAGGRAHEKLEVVIDSGASACALPLGWCDHYPTRPLEAGARTTYRTANGGIVNATGRKSIFGETTAGKHVGLSFVEMNVHRPLASVSQMVKKGNMVVFGHSKKGAFVYNKATGLEHPLEERNGIYILPVWVTENKGKFAHKAADGDLHVTVASENTTVSPGGASSSFHRLARWP